MGRPRKDPLASQESKTPAEPPKYVIPSHVKRLRERAQLEYVVESSPAASEGEHDARAGLSDEPVDNPVDLSTEPPGEVARATSPAEDTDEEPPDPVFVIAENRFGPGVHSVKFTDGTPVGVWLSQARGDADPAAVAAELLALGLPAKHAEDFARRRAIRDDAQAEFDRMLRDSPNSVLAQALRNENDRDARMHPIRAAFIKAQGKK